jgi:hypothetical protein
MPKEERMAREESRRREQGQDKGQASRQETENNTENNEEFSEERAGKSGQWGDPTDAPVVEISFEEIMELQDELEGDDALGDIIDTAHSDGSTENVHVAMDQGLVYTPPTDPPVIPSDDLQGAEIAAGFASSIEDEPEIANLPERVDDNDTDAEDDIRRALLYNSETTHLDDVRVYVRDGVAYVRGSVFDDDDIAAVDALIRALDIVDEIQIELDEEG